jgi:hypothetical protein
MLDAALAWVDAKLKALPPTVSLVGSLTYWGITLACFFNPATIRLGFCLLGARALLIIHRAAKAKQLEVVLLTVTVFSFTVLGIVSAYDWFGAR